MKKYSFLRLLLAIVVVIGIADTAFLTYERVTNRIVPCATGLFVDCGKVLHSTYSLLFGIPLTTIGLVHYSLLFFVVMLVFFHPRNVWKKVLFLQTCAGFIASLYFVFLQIAIIHAICIYCMLSALLSTTLFFFVRYIYITDYKQYVIWLFSLSYQFGIKHIFFLMDAERVHTLMTRSGEVLFRYTNIRNSVAFFLKTHPPALAQTIAGIHVPAPVGLSAGFDYEARLTQVIPALGFGFGTVGTITNQPYEGNKTPRLGRLPKSKSLMVHKGFKNEGADSIIQKLQQYSFTIPIGISIGRTNVATFNNQQEAITDIVHAFNKFETSPLKHAYYELNISCPNLTGGITFYPPANLRELLDAITHLHIQRPIFIKMPIEKSDEEVLEMLQIIAQFPIAGVIFGNLQKDRTCTAFDQHEVSQWNVGNFSGKPTEKRSNELISLAYQHYGKKYIIIGCGGIFNAEDAYKKIKLGASMVQLITGMIYQGPQLIAEINHDLTTLLHRDGYTHISQAIGVDTPHM